MCFDRHQMLGNQPKKFHKIRFCPHRIQDMLFGWKGFRSLPPLHLAPSEATEAMTPDDSDRLDAWASGFAEARGAKSRPRRANEPRAPEIKNSAFPTYFDLQSKVKTTMKTTWRIFPVVQFLIFHVIWNVAITDRYYGGLV